MNIKKSKMYRNYRLFKLIGFGQAILNFIIQRIFCIDNDFKHMKSWQSRVLNGEKIYFDEKSIHTLRSFANSLGCYFNAEKGIEIGSDTIWGPNVTIVSMNHDVSNIHLHNNEKSGVKIGKSCWISAGVTILPGVEIGDHVVIGANSVVTKSFKRGNEVIAGTPAVKVKDII